MATTTPLIEATEVDLTMLVRTFAQATAVIRDYYRAGNADKAVARVLYRSRDAAALALAQAVTRQALANDHDDVDSAGSE